MSASDRVSKPSTAPARVGLDTGLAAPFPLCLFGLVSARAFHSASHGAADLKRQRGKRSCQRLFSQRPRLRPANSAPSRQTAIKRGVVGSAAGSSLHADGQKGPMAYGGRGGVAALRTEQIEAPETDMPG